MQHNSRVELSDPHNHGLSSIDWQEVVIGEKGEGIQTIEYLAERRFNQGPLAEESVNYVLEKISQNEWQLCSGFKGNARAKTFARRVIVNLLEEFSRKRFGRPRPPTWILKQDEIWVEIWKELYLERQLLPSVVDRYSSQGLYDEEEIRDIATVIKARIPSCGQATLEPICVDDIVSASNQAVMEQRSSPLQQTASTLEQDECGYHFELNARAEIILGLKAIVKEPLPTCSVEPVSAETIDIKAKLYNHLKLENIPLQEGLPLEIQLSHEEVILLRMLYRDGLSRATAAKKLGLNNYQTNMKLSDILKRIRTMIEHYGVDFESLLAKIQH